MNEAAKNIQNFHSLHPFQFDMVSRLELTVSPLVDGYTTVLVLRCISSKGEGRPQTLFLNFEEIRDLKFRARGAVPDFLGYSRRL